MAYSFGKWEEAGMAAGLWSGRPDLNRRPHRPERCALPSCATSRRGRECSETADAPIAGGCASDLLDPDAVDPIAIHPHHYQAVVVDGELMTVRGYVSGQC